MFGTETQFANDFAKSSVAATLREAGLGDVSMFDGGVMVNGASTSDVREAVDINPANVKKEEEFVVVYI